MWARLQAFWMPKHGNLASDYEDAFWPRHLSRECGELRIAIADGATETSFAALWARLLVRAYAKHQWNGDLGSVELTRIRRAWKRCTKNRPLPWYAEEKARLGAFSSLL